MNKSQLRFQPQGTLYRGTIVDIAGKPHWAQIDTNLRFIRDGALIVDHNGAIIYCGDYSGSPESYSHKSRDGVYDTVDFRPGFIFPGFIDTHIHFPQTFSTHSWSGGHLIRWLDECIFPAESKLADVNYAETIAKTFVNQRIASGTTAAVVMGSAFPIAQDLLFEHTRSAGLRMIGGRGIQTCGSDSATALIATEEKTLEMVIAEIDAWHNRDLLKVAIMPRSPLSITQRTLSGLSEIFYHYYDQGIYFHTHLSESKDDEIPAVLSSYNVDSYLDIFDNRIPGAHYKDTFVTRHSIFAHGVYLCDNELLRLTKAQASIAHCPSSQLFLGNATMPWQRTCNAGVTIALGSDIGGGDQWVIPQVANIAFKVHCGPDNQDPVFITPAQLLYLSTLSGAIAIDQDNVIGNFDIGKDADFVVIDPQQSPIFAQNLAYLQDLASYDVGHESAVHNKELFALIMGIRENVISAMYVRGKKIDKII